MTAISVTFPSRSRPASLIAAITSMIVRADDPDSLEFLVALDPDDPLLGEATVALAASGAHPVVWTAPERFGYTRLHWYWNQLATMACGDWLMLWNDDARMLTEGWDTIVRGSAPAVLWPEANHVPHACQFGIWPRAWTKAIGHVSLSPHVDTWMQTIAQHLGILTRIPVQVLHDRCDVTGGHDDQTYAEGRALLGPEGMADNFRGHYPQILADAETIRGLLRAS
jgi:hypothetical protein